MNFRLIVLWVLFSIMLVQMAYYLLVYGGFVIFYFKGMGDGSNAIVIHG